MEDEVERERRWRVPGQVVGVKAVGLGVALALMLFSLDDRRAVILCGVVALGLAVLVLRDLLVPVRMSADEHGITVVRGFSGRDRIPWADVERVTVDVRHRYGRRWEHMEIDVGERIYVFGSATLGMSCTDAAAELRGMRSMYHRGEGG